MADKIADNVTLDPGAGGATVAADDVAGVHYQRVKLDIGADGAASGTAGTASVPVRVDPTGSTAQPITDNGGSITVDGTVAVTGVATSAKQDTMQTALDAMKTALEIIDNVVSGSEAQVDVLTVPADPFGANADAAATAGSTGSIQAKLRLLTSQMDAIKTSVETMDNAVSGSAFTVVQGTGTNLHAVVDSGTITTVSAVTAISNALPAGTNNIGDVDVLTVPTDPFGANADAASATGSISAKLRFIAATGIPITGTVTVGSHAVTNAGTFVVQENGTWVQVDDAAFTPATSKIAMVGFEADESSTDSVDEGDGGAARMTLDRKQIVTLQPHTAGGLSTFMASGSDGSSILVATKQTIKASAGQLYGWYLYNPEAAVSFVHIYNTDTVTVGTTNPQISIPVPAGSAANVSFPQGISFSTAMSCAATTTAGGNTAPATGVSAVFLYA